MDTRDAPSLGDMRRRAGMTQEAVAEAVGVSVATVQNWERGLYSPKKGMLAALTGLYEGNSVA